MLDLWRQLKMLPFLREAALSLALLLGVLVVVRLAAEAVRRSQLPADVRHRWLVRIRNSAILFLPAGLIVIWGTEVRALALSLVAVAAAIAIATKELLLCLSGAFVRTSSRAFGLGDRIEVAGLRGDVVDLGALTTTILEVGPGHSNRTGRAVVLPNSLFVSMPVVNETPSGDFLLHTLAVPLPRDADWRAAEEALLASARVECDGFLRDAHAALARSATHKGLDPSNVEPRVTLRLLDAKQLELLVRFPAPVRLRNRVEQGVLRGFLERLAER